jgi:hypothetical protein
MAKNAKARPVSHRCGYIPWQVLMRQLGIDVETCPRCGGKMKIIALVQDAESIARYLRHLGLPTEEPSMAPARGPPFWQSRVLRRRYAEPADTAPAWATSRPSCRPPPTATPPAAGRRNGPSLC